MAWKRKVEELEEDNRSLPDLLDAIRTGEDDQVDRLVAFIRSQASQSEVVDYVANNFIKASSTADHEDGRSKSSTRQQSPSLHQPRLPRSIQQSLRPWITVSAHPWTTVTDDDDLVSHLVSLWFTWRHWCYPFIERDEFVTAMRSKDVESPVCTPALVNMILADACFDYDLPNDAQPTSANERPLRDLFFDEARRHMESSKSKRSLSAIQYLGVQWM
ncbi:hypothetical protein LTR84_002056 [Exophiala bonariae]|uniref:Uncharacterized protein n=1 Tax=Exophiala bonariae TaxID=1690606 RepID=A0AAV9NAF4_9EURO|nr:hypothetical protein LTR84_002056 [Exophiala bonariae]